MQCPGGSIGKVDLVDLNNRSVRPARSRFRSLRWSGVWIFSQDVAGDIGLFHTANRIVPLVRVSHGIATRSSFQNEKRAFDLGVYQKLNVTIWTPSDGCVSWRRCYRPCIVWLSAASIRYLALSVR